MPLDFTLRQIGREDLATRLMYSSTHIIGLGLRGENPHDTKCWLYYPEDNCPFYRCTVFSLYGTGNVPRKEDLLPTLRLGDKTLEVSDTTARSGPYWSLMFEVSESSYKPVDINTVIEVGALYLR